MDLIKQKLLEACLQFCEDLIDRTQKEFDFATEAANSENKSSAGDKHETGRAMAQIEQEKAAKQLNEALDLKSYLVNLKPANASDKITIGNLVITDKGSFYISIPAGKISIEQTSYYAISAQSPIGTELLGKKKGESISIVGKTYTIENII